MSDDQDVCEWVNVSSGQGSKWDSTRQYAIPELPWMGKNHTVTSFRSSVIPVYMQEIWYVDSQENH